MLVNNYYLIQSYFDKNGFTGGGSDSTTISGTKDYIDGQNCPMGTGALYANSNACTRRLLSVVLGTGNTAPSLMDYQLENDISSSLSLSCSVNTGAENGTIKTVLAISGINGTNSEVTIKEFGIIKEYYANKGGFQNVKHLIARELLKTPKVVGAGEPFTITFEWSGS